MVAEQAEDDERDGEPELRCAEFGDGFGRERVERVADHGRRIHDGDELVE